MTLLEKGIYRVVDARGADDRARVMALRAQAFPADRAGPDVHDTLCRHILIEDVRDGQAVCTFRLLPLSGGAEIGVSYSARHYGLEALSGFGGPMVELGRFCIHPARRDGDILRVAWGALTQIVDRDGIEMLFGCASFPGTDAQPHAEAFALLNARHVAPRRWRPRVTSPRVVELARSMARPFDPRRAMAAMPPLLRTYLAMGGRVSDHAVVDDEMGTMHVFTGVEIGAIPPARKRLLRTVAG